MLAGINNVDYTPMIGYDPVPPKALDNLTTNRKEATS